MENEELLLDQPEETTEVPPEETSPEQEYYYPTSSTTSSETYSDEFVRDLCSSGEIEYLTYQEHQLCYSIKESDMVQETYDVTFVFANIILGVLMGFIAVRGMLDPWNK